MLIQHFLIIRNYYYNSSNRDNFNFIQILASTDRIKSFEEEEKGKG